MASIALQPRLLATVHSTRIRHILQDWAVWLSKQDSKGNDVNLHLENIYLDELQEDGLLLYERIKVPFCCFDNKGAFL